VIKELDGRSITTVVTNMLNKLTLLLVALTIGVIVGEHLAIENIKKDCGYLEKFRHIKEVYSCKKIH
jgi:hypothetical protein